LLHHVSFGRLASPPVLKKVAERHRILEAAKASGARLLPEQEAELAEYSLAGWKRILIAAMEVAAARPAHRRSDGRGAALPGGKALPASGLVHHAQSRSCCCTPAARIGSGPGFEELETVFVEGRKSGSRAEWPFLAARIVRPPDSERTGIFPCHPLCSGESGQGWIDELAVGMERGLGSPRNSRLGSRRYSCLDPDCTPGNLIFNRTLPLKDSWARIEKKAGT
ncbi:MAG: hypothetical protein ACRD19_13340, partial [Terriglobia bacterium]